MYSMGDCVVYRHDLCKVVGYEENYVDQDDYFVLEAIFQKAMKYYVPVRSLDLLLRPVLTRQQALDFIDSLPAVPALDETVLDGMQQRRNRPGQGSMSSSNKLHDAYRTYMKNSSLEELVPLIKLIHARMSQREAASQSPIATDREFYQKVEQILSNELAVSLDMDPADVVPFVEQRTGLKFYEPSNTAPSS